MTLDSTVERYGGLLTVICILSVAAVSCHPGMFSGKSMIGDLSKTRSTFSFTQFTNLVEFTGRFIRRRQKALDTSPSESVRFDLYTRKEPDNPKRIFAAKNSSVLESTFDPRKPTKFIIHGFISHQGPKTGGEALKNAFLEYEDCNVVTVDWSEADPSEYLSAVRVTVPRVGGELAQLMRLICSLGANPATFHILGHSLGAQMAGFAGRLVLGKANTGRITGLDPAGPLFEGFAMGQRLSPSDAAFVDVIHTDGGYLGYRGPTGHIDFYPNGGTHILPGCGMDPSGLCSHCMVYDYFLDSMRNPGSYVFRRCDSWAAFQNGECSDNDGAVMGTDTDPRSRGSYYLNCDLPIREALRTMVPGSLVMSIINRNTSIDNDIVAQLRC